MTTRRTYILVNGYLRSANVPAEKKANTDMELLIKRGSSISNRQQRLFPPSSAQIEQARAATGSALITRRCGVEALQGPAISCSVSAKNDDSVHAYTEI